MKRLLLVVILIIPFLSAKSAFAVTDEEVFRAFSLNFLATPGARAIGMGATFIGRADDATATESNPAGLTILSRPEVSFEYRHIPENRVSTSDTNIPIVNLDVTPPPGFGIFDRSPGVASFTSLDRQLGQDQPSFVSVVYPFPRRHFTVGFSRHELIKNEAEISNHSTASPFHFLEENSFAGTSKLSDTNYNFAIGVKVGDRFSFGGTAKISHFEISSNIGGRQRTEPDFGDHFIGTTDTQQTKLGFNAGALIKLAPKVSLGAVYKYEPKFNVRTAVVNTDFNPNPLIISRSGITDINFNIPDSIGLGLSVTPAQAWTVNVDVLRILYTQQETVDLGFSEFTHLLPLIGNANQVRFKYEDGTEIHLGAEYFFVTKKGYVLPVRGGYYRQKRNRFFLDSAADADVRTYLSSIFGTDAGKDLQHWTLGSGVSYRGFQTDFAFDFSQKNQVNEGNRNEVTDSRTTFVLSTVFHF